MTGTKCGTFLDAQSYMPLHKKNMTVYKRNEQICKPCIASCDGPNLLLTKPLEQWEFGHYEIFTKEYSDYKVVFNIIMARYYDSIFIA